MNSQNKQLAVEYAQRGPLGNTRRRTISQQMGGDVVRFAKRRVVRIGSGGRRLDVAGNSGATCYVTFIEDGDKLGRTIEREPRRSSGHRVEPLNLLAVRGQLPSLLGHLLRRRLLLLAGWACGRDGVAHAPEGSRRSRPNPGPTLADQV